MRNTVTSLAVAILTSLLVLGMLGPFASTASAALPLGSKMPPLIGGPEDWINTGGKTFHVRTGVPILVDFWEYTCVNCIRTDPYLRTWYQRYKPYGLVIVGIQTPEFAFSAQRNNVAAAARRDKLTYPILNDPESRNWKAYNESFWPSKYLFDQNGRLVYAHAGEGNYQETERMIQRLLLKSHPGAKFPAPLSAVRPGDVVGAGCRTDSPELYTNPSYGFDANLPRGWRMDKTATFVDRGHHVDGKVYASGAFITRYQSLQHARATRDLHDYVAIRFHGTEVNTVVNRPANRAYNVYLTLDGRPIPRTDKGDDIRYDARGSYILVDAPRMFNVYRGNYGTHELKLASDSPDFDIYSFTFSGCNQK
jgi:thiol-disulfide isomerase/thioredoxin